MKKSLTASFEVKNGGEADLFLSSHIREANGSEFVIKSGGGDKALKSGQKVVLKVSFAPITAGYKQSTLSLASNDTDTALLEIPLSGTGQNERVATPAFSKKPGGNCIMACLICLLPGIGRTCFTTLRNHIIFNH